MLMAIKIGEIPGFLLVRFLDFADVYKIDNRNCSNLPELGPCYDHADATAKFGSFYNDAMREGPHGMGFPAIDGGRH
jgi:hypothetical protein